MTITQYVPTTHDEHVLRRRGLGPNTDLLTPVATLSCENDGRTAILVSCLYMPSAAELIAEGREARSRDAFAAARCCYAAAAAIYREQNDRLAYAHTIRHVADIYQDESNLDDAKPLYEESIEFYGSSLSTKILDLANALRPYALLSETPGKLESAS